MAPRGHALVLDGEKVHTLDLVRSLGRAGIAVTVGAARDGGLAFASRFARACVVYPDPAVDAGRFIDWVEDRVQADGVDVVIPVTDRTLVPLARHRSRFDGRCAVAAESFDKVRLVCDKARTLEIARRVGVPVPRTIVVRHAGDLASSAGQLTFPVVCKPQTSTVWSEAGFRSLPVFYALDPDELHREVPSRLAAGPVLLQEYRRGAGVGLEVLAEGGVIRQAFQHRRLHELPLTGGGSTYRVSEPVDPRLRDYAARLLADVGWTGVAMVEFKVDDARNDAVLMEINGRFWGSVALSSRAGLDFVVALYDLLARGTTPVERPYAAGVRCRRLRDDIEWFKSQVALGPRDRAVTAGLVRRLPRPELMREMARLLSFADRWDVQLWWDPLPGLVDMRDVVMAQIAGARRRVARALGPVRSSWYRLRHRRRLAATAHDARRVLFICFGNILRSPFAGGYLQRHGTAAGGRLETACAGLHELTDRPADPRAIDAARAWGVDLSAHRSRRADADLVAWADLILVMDRHNLDAMRRLHPAAARKTFLLGALEGGDGGDVEIADPFTGPPDATRDAYARIAGAIDGLVERARSASPGPAAVVHEAGR